MRATVFAIMVLAFGFQIDTNPQQQPTLKDANKGCFLSSPLLAFTHDCPPRRCTCLSGIINEAGRTGVHGSPGEAGKTPA
jgi:hypothetical protein